MVAQKTKSILLKVDLFFLLPGEKKKKINDSIFKCYVSLEKDI